MGFVQGVQQLFSDPKGFANGIIDAGKQALNVIKNGTVEENYELMGNAFGTILGAYAVGKAGKFLNNKFISPKLKSIKLAHQAAKNSSLKVVVEPGKTGVWEMNKWTRGWKVEERLGGMCNNFKTIDKFDSVNNTMSSIKSMDLACKTYQNTATITSRLTGYIDKVANYTRGSYGKTLSFTANEATQRFLDLAIPPCATQAQMEAIQAAAEYGQTVGVQVIVHIME